MEIKLNHEEICTAILDFAEQQGLNVANFEVHLTAGRGANGYSAELKAAAKKTRKSPAKKKTEAAPKEEVAEKQIEEALPEVETVADDPVTAEGESIFN